MKTKIRAVFWLSFLTLIFLGNIIQLSNGVDEIFYRHLIFSFFSVFICFLFSKVNFRVIIKKIDVIYWLGIVSLIYLVIFGVPVRGTRAWINLSFFSVQPSEFMKIISIIIIAKYLTRKHSQTFYDFYFFKETSYQVQLKHFFTISFFIFIPALLIVKQPDHGTFFLFLLIWTSALYLSAVSWKIVLFLILTGMFTFLNLIFLVIYNYLPVVSGKFNFYIRIFQNGYIFLIIGFILWFIVYELNYILSPVIRKPLKYPPALSILILSLFCASLLLSAGYSRLKPHHRVRFIAFMDETVDPLGSGYNIIQSKIAIGSGGLFGKGFKQGTQHRLGFLPEARTDFALSIFLEEFGFIGAIFLFIIMLIFYYSLSSIALIVSNQFGKLFVYLYSFVFISQLAVNALMATGNFPVIGITFPFISYGGSSLLSFSIGAGLCLSVLKFDYKRV